MKALLNLASLAVVAYFWLRHRRSATARAIRTLVATHARANNVPEALVHRVIVRESRYHPELVGRGGTIGLMQIKLATARGLGYTGDAAGLRDPETNLTYGVKYLAGAYRAAKATTPAPCIIMRAAIITLQSASASNVAAADAVAGERTAKGSRAACGGRC